MLAAILAGFLSLPTLAAGPNTFELRDPTNNQIIATIDATKNAVFPASFTASSFYGDGYNLSRIINSSTTKISSASFSYTNFSVCFATVTLSTRGFPVTVTLSAIVDNESANEKIVYSSLLVDGDFDAEVSNKSISAVTVYYSYYGNVGYSIQINGIAAGIHSFCATFKVSGGVGRLYSDGSFYSQFSVSESAR